jgi:acyl dehydratase
VVHFHIHTNGEATEDEDGHAIIVPRWIIDAVWIGLMVLMWSGAAFLLVETVRELEKL